MIPSPWNSNLVGSTPQHNEDPHPIAEDGLMSVGSMSHDAGNMAEDIVLDVFSFL